MARTEAVAPKKGEHVETASPDFRQVSWPKSHTICAKEELSLIKKAQNASSLLGGCSGDHLRLQTLQESLRRGVQKACRPEQSSTSAVAMVTWANSLRNTLWWWLNSSNCIKELLLIYAYQVPCQVATCPRHKLLFHRSWKGITSTGYQPERDNLAGKELQKKLLTWPPSCSLFPLPIHLERSPPWLRSQFPLHLKHKISTHPPWRQKLAIVSFPKPC